jgi:hypothetical protein
MARVVLGRIGSEVVVASDRCVKSGVPTSQRIVVRGRTTPGWVHVLLVFTIIGWLFASGMASRRYRVEVPFRHELYDRWRRINRAAWLLGLLGAGLTLWATVAGGDRAGMFLAIAVGGLALGLGNALLHNVGVRQQDASELVLTRVHPDAAAAIIAAHSVRS